MSALLVPAGVAAGALLGAFWLWTLLRFHRAGLAFPELRSDSHPAPPAATSPRISVLVACKDEEGNIEGCVRSILAQDWPDLELVVADDRSADRTPEILARLSEELHPRLKVVRVEQVPAGWGGQNHGFHCAAQAATGEWLCFTDADCRFDSARTIASAYAEARAHGARFLSILPRMAAPTAWERVYLPLCSFMFLKGLDVTDTNHPDRPAASAYGPFMLMTRAAYQALGGHVRVGGLINGDVCLARIAKREGVPFRLVSNTDLCQTRMYETAGAAWSGWSRNYYHSIQRAPKLAGVLLTTLALFVAPWAGLLAALGLLLALPATWPVALTWGLLVLVSHTGLWRLYGAFAAPGPWSLLYPVGAVFVAGIAGRALLQSVLRTGTTWHGVHYPHPTWIPAPVADPEVSCPSR